MKNFNFIKIVAEGGKFVVECVSKENISLKCLFHLNCEVFPTKKLRNFSNLEKLENLIKKYFFRKKTVSSFSKTSLRKLKGGKYAAGSWPFCFFKQKTH